ncbi:MAG: DUF4124 domain-containing protein [Motiliproteus sp.]
MKLYRKILVLPLAALLLPVVAQADIYRWIDDNGVTNYSDNPPANVNAELFKSIAIPTAKKNSSVKARSESSIGNFLKRVDKQKKSSQEKKNIEKKKQSKNLKNAAKTA